MPGNDASVCGSRDCERRGEQDRDVAGNNMGRLGTGYWALLKRFRLSVEYPLFRVHIPPSPIEKTSGMMDASNLELDNLYVWVYLIGFPGAAKAFHCDATSISAFQNQRR